MATRGRDDLSLVPPQSGHAGYRRDFHAWASDQARLLREGHWTAIDRDNLAEEIEALGRTEFNRLESALRILLLHILKWDHQSGKRTRSWGLSIAAQRLEVDDLLADSPSLQPRLHDAMARAYRKARIAAAQETGLDLAAFPAQCPYAFEDAMTRAFSL